MASVMQMRWDGITQEQYDAMRPIAQWENDHPDGAIFHVAYFTDGGINVVDVWESPQQFDRFMEERLGRAIQEVGAQGEPQIQWFDAHAIFNPQALRQGAPA